MSTEFTKLFRQELSSRLINIFMNDIDMIPINENYKLSKYTDQESELQFNKCGELASGLKKIVFKCINNNDRVYSYEQNGKIVLQKLTDLYLNMPMYLPPEYRAEELIKIYEDYHNVDREKLQKRLVCDYVAGMMDSYAISMYEKFSGTKFMGGHY